MSKKVIRCKKCNQRIFEPVAGFVKSNDMNCAKFNCHVEPDDGCTFGEEGDPIYKACQCYDVHLRDHETVWGWRRGLY